MDSISRGSPPQSIEGAVYEALVILSHRSPIVVASNGALPVTISYKTTPSAQISDLASAFPPLICSGERYCRVPTTLPSTVSDGVDEDFAIPKSSSFTSPAAVIFILLDLMSR